MDSVECLALRRGEHILAAVSGGADSVALLCALAKAARDETIQLDAAHFEHGIRGRSSVDDAAFVRSLCASLGVPLHEGHADVPALAAARGVGLELAAREARYAFLRRVRRAIGADVIALAHHMDDQAETVLMHLLRGAGLRGLCGMREREGDLFRPFLGRRKAELTAYLVAQGIAWREDATNALADTPRNQLRLAAMPALARIYPGMTASICRFARIAALDDDCLAQAALSFARANVVALPIGPAVSLAEATHPAILARVLKRLCPAADGRTIEALLELCARARGAVNLPGGARAERAGDRLYLIERAHRSDFSAPLLLPGEVRIPEIGLLRAWEAPPTPIRDDPCCQTLRAQALAGAVVRFRRPGDRIHPLGAPGRQKLSDYLGNRRVDRPLRDLTPLIARGSDVLWVVGAGISEQAKLTGAVGERGMRLTMHFEQYKRGIGGNDDAQGFAGGID